MARSAISPDGRDRRAVFLGRLPNGQRVFRFTVRVERGERAALGDVEAWMHPQVFEVQVTAATAADAANLIRDEWAPREACVSVETWGPQGGVTRRWVGFEAHIWARMGERPAPQTALL